MDRYSVVLVEPLFSSTKSKQDGRNTASWAEHNRHYSQDVGGAGSPACGHGRKNL
uniref:Uncharacterized protein n=1 Tax=Oryzias latipes TaxID=8090 RepID=A0A3B3HTX4_ORYLA